MLQKKKKRMLANQFVLAKMGDEVGADNGQGRTKITPCETFSKKKKNHFRKTNTLWDLLKDSRFPWGCSLDLAK